MPRLKQTHNDLAVLLSGEAETQRVSKTKIADLLGVSRPTVYKIMRDPVSNMRLAMRLGRYLQIPREKFMEAIPYQY